MHLEKLIVYVDAQPTTYQILCQMEKFWHDLSLFFVFRQTNGKKKTG